VITSPFPTFDYAIGKLLNGSTVKVCSLCQTALDKKPACRAHYESLKQRPPGFYQCPSGFTSRSFFWGGALQAITGVIAFPRFGSLEESNLAKKYPENKCARSEAEALVEFYRLLDVEKANSLQQQATIFPQAFHELRKLNAAVLQTAEKELREHSESRALKSIMSAAELMRNNFDILEALARVERMSEMPLDSTINLFDLTYKTRCIYEQRATSRGINLVQQNGDRALIRGSQKSFPIVPAVLIENAIKYSVGGTRIDIYIRAEAKHAVLQVLNQTDGYIDPEKCFERGTRFSSTVEGSGFGLFLAKQIVEAHGGKILCQQVGTTVTMRVTLPLLSVRSAI
jgi:signal transduction histidine kinase